MQVTRLSDRMRLDGRVALVTGGAGHLGRQFAFALAEYGANVAVVDRDGEAARAVAEEVARTHAVETRGYAVDLESSAEVEALPAQVAEELGGLGILVNNAAFVGTSDLQGWAVAFERQSFDTWRRALETNLTAPVALVQRALPHLRASGHGSVVNVASIYGLVGPDWRLYADSDLGNPAAYAASKGSLVQMTRWLATTLAPEVRVNAIAPGGIFRNQPESFVDSYVARTPLGRMAREDDMLGGVVYFAGDLSAYVTGQCLAIDGGWTSW